MGQGWHWEKGVSRRPRNLGLLSEGEVSSFTVHGRKRRS